MQIKLTRSALKDLNKLPPQKRAKIITALKSIDSPTIGKKLKGELAEKYSLRIWPYRIIYEIYQGMIVIKSIKHRQGAYK
jgi:mRNA-degrading endonuclease RelE of RelBE toxin-antitoxin system